MKSAPTLLAALLGLMIPAVEAASPYAQWPQWRGPLGNGVAPQANPPVTWSETQNVKWKAAVPGFGTSTPIIWGDKIFLVTAIGPENAAAPTGKGMTTDKPTEKHQFVVLCLARETGKILWQTKVREEVPHEAHHKDHGFASATPVTDGKMLYAYFGSRGLYALDFEGKVKWEKDFGDMQTRNSFGEGSSPALHGDTLIIPWDHEGEDFIVALDKTTGEEKWRKTRDEPTNWTSPYILEDGSRTLAVVNGNNKVRAYDVKNGDVVWECGGQTLNCIPTPVSGHGLVIAMSGFRGNALQAIKLGRTGDLTGTDAIAWSYNKGTPYVPSPLLYGDELYFFGGNNAMLSIFDAKTGNRHVETERLSGMTGVYASPIAAAGKVYLTGRDGGFLVLKAGPKVEVLATNKLSDKFDASPAAVGKELYLRGHESLYCISEGK